MPWLKAVIFTEGETLGRYIGIVGGLQSGTFPVTFLLGGEALGVGPLSAGALWNSPRSVLGFLLCFTSFMAAAYQNLVEASINNLTWLL